MGIEPTSSAWKAEVLPLNYTRLTTFSLARYWWREEDSNLRRRSQQIYSLPPLTARESLHRQAHHSSYKSQKCQLNQPIYIVYFLWILGA